MPLFLIKKDNRRQSFDRQKLVAGMSQACQKRPVSADTIQEAALDIERRAQEMGEREIASQWFGEQVMQALRQMDEVAYVRFASVYRSFRDVEEFAEELKRLRQNNNAESGGANARPTTGHA
jgi:transcriptional repressor NrdR